MCLKKKKTEVETVLELNYQQLGFCCVNIDALLEAVVHIHHGILLSH